MTRLIKEKPGRGRLGRHVHFDERSRRFTVTPLHGGARIASKLWLRRIGPFDQGELGSCTGNGMAGVLATAPFRRVGEKVNEWLAVRIYGEATQLDPFPGSYPPDDTGSSVLAAAKAAKKLGLITGYHWCFGLDDVLRTLSVVGPVEVGVNWYSGFDTPDASSWVKISGSIRGGHAFTILAVDSVTERVTAINSWGHSYGRNGRFSISWKDLDRLLREDGEAATIVR